MRICSAGALLAVFLCLLASSAAFAQESTYAKDGFYVGGSLTYGGLSGDFDGNHVLTDSGGILLTQQYLLLPDFKNSTGFGLIFGYRRGWYAGEITYQQSRPDWSMRSSVGSLSTTGTATLAFLNFNYKVYFNQLSRLQPYAFIGPSVCFLTIDDGSTDDDGHVGDGRLTGFGGNVGVGLAYYINDRICLSGDVSYRDVFFDSYEGVAGSGHLPGGYTDGSESDSRIFGSGLACAISITYTF